MQGTPTSIDSVLQKILTKAPIVASDLNRIDLNQLVTYKGTTGPLFAFLQMPFNDIDLANMSILLSYGANPNIPVDNSNKTILMIATASGLERYVKELLLNGADPNIIRTAAGGPGREGMTALKYAATSTTSILQRFFAQANPVPTDINLAPSTTNESALHFAVKAAEYTTDANELNNLVENIKVLCSQGANKTLRNSANQTPQSLATKPKVIDALKSCKAPVLAVGVAAAAAAKKPFTSIDLSGPGIPAGFFGGSGKTICISVKRKLKYKSKSRTKKTHKKK